MRFKKPQLPSGEYRSGSADHAAIAIPPLYSNDSKRQEQILP
jgi:hypothetical protein